MPKTNLDIEVVKGSATIRVVRDGVPLMFECGTDIELEQEMLIRLIAHEPPAFGGRFKEQSQWPD